MWRFQRRVSAALRDSRAMMLSPVSEQPSPPASRELAWKQPQPLKLGAAALEFAPSCDPAGRLWTVVFEQIKTSEALTMNERGGSIPLVCREWRRLAELHFSIFSFPLAPAAALSTMLATVGMLEPDLTAPESNPRSGDKAVWFYTGKITHTRGPRTVAKAVWRSTQAKSLFGATLVHCPHGLSLAVSAGQRRGVVAVLFGRDCIWGVTAYPRPSVKWDGDILSFLFACTRFASSMEETWCDSFDANSVLKSVTQSGQMHSTQARNAVAELVERFVTNTTVLNVQQERHLVELPLQYAALHEQSQEKEDCVVIEGESDSTAVSAIALEIPGLASEQVFLATDKRSRSDEPTVNFPVAAELVVDWRVIGQRHVCKLRADYATASRAPSSGFSPSGQVSGRCRSAQAYLSSRHGCIGGSPRLSVCAWSMHIDVPRQVYPAYESSSSGVALEMDCGWQCILTWYENFEKILFKGLIRDGNLVQGGLWYFVTIFEEIFDGKATAVVSSEGGEVLRASGTGRSGLEWMGQMASVTWGGKLCSMVAATAERLAQSPVVKTFLRRYESVHLWWQYALDRMHVVLAASAAAQRDSPGCSRGAGDA